MNTQPEETDTLLPFPRVVRIEPASQCNLACNHCPTGTVDMPRGIMKQETFDKVLEAIESQHDKVKVVVLYHGGEPFLNKRLFEMIKDLRKVGNLLIKTVSNGMLMTDAMLPQLAECGLDIIEFSLDGQTAEQNDEIRIKGKYSKIVSNIKKLIAYLNEHHHNKPEVFIATTQFKNQTAQDKNGQPTLPQFLVEEFSGIHKIASSHFKSTYAMRWPHMNIPEDHYRVVIEQETDEVKNLCDHVINTITIRDNGDVVPCCYDLTSQSVMGNIHEKSLNTIWNSADYRNLRRSIHTKQFIPLCDNCNVVKPPAYLHLKDYARHQS